MRRSRVRFLSGAHWVVPPICDWVVGFHKKFQPPSHKSGRRKVEDGHVDLRDLVEQAERKPLADSDGKSGATLERAVLADGRSVIVKKFDPDSPMPE